MKNTHKAYGAISPFLTYLQISELVHEVIALFGSNRCMFASNYPVDKPQVSPKAMYDQFQEFTKDMDRADVQNLFFNSANEFYKF